MSEDIRRALGFDSPENLRGVGAELSAKLRNRSLRIVTLGAGQASTFILAWLPSAARC